MRMYSTGQRIGGCVLAMAMALAMGGCGCSVQQNQTQEPEPAVEEQTGAESATDADESAADVRIEQQVPDDAQGELAEAVFTNQTGYDIKAVSLKAAGAPSYEEDYVIGDVNLPNEATATVSVRPIMVDGAPVESYDIRLTTTDDGIIECLNVDLFGSNDLVLHFEDGIGYVSFLDSETNEVTDNREEAEQAESDNVGDIQTYDMDNQRG